MKRDPDLIRKILFAIEQDPGDGYIVVKVDGYTDKEINYHLSLLHDANFFVGFDERYDDESHWLVSRLTWDGHEFIEAARDDTRWKAVKNKMSQLGGFVIEVAKPLLIEMLKQQAGL